MAILVYTTTSCPYCEQAKNLLDRKKVAYQVVDVSQDFKKRQRLIEKSNGLRTVPQIFIDEQHIGGFDALRRLDMQGELDVLIKPYMN